jgi:hypothetical protein
VATESGFRGDANKQLRRAVPDGFQRAGLTHAQLTQAIEWYKDHTRPGMDEAKLMENFAEFAAARGWQGVNRRSKLALTQSR